MDKKIHSGSMGLIMFISICYIIVFYPFQTITSCLWANTAVSPAEDTANLARAAAESPAPESPAPADTFMTRWLILGPVPVFEGEADEEDRDSQIAAFDGDPISIPLSGVEAGAEAEIHGRSLMWEEARSKAEVFDLQQVLGEHDFVYAYAWTEFQVPGAGRALLAVGSDDAVKVWLNGKLVHRNWIDRPLNRDQDLISVDLAQGTNTLLLKIQDLKLDWSFSCRLLGAESLVDRTMAAARAGNLDDLEMLLSHGVDVDAVKPPGLTALHLAQIHGRPEAVQMLIDNGADAGTPMPSKETLVDHYFEEAVDSLSPGAAVLIAKDGEILYKKGFGYADLSHRAAITSETKFRIGSVTKQFTAAAILKLQQEGALDVTDRLSKFLPDFPRAGEVTIHHLLTHTSGIHSYTSKPDFYKMAPTEIEPDELIESIMEDEYDFDPGEQWLYNNSGYFLLGAIVEKTSGLSYGDYLRKTFFEPLGMKNTGIHDRRTILENEARGYERENGRYIKALNWDMSRAGGAGALYSTVHDLYLWNEAVFNGDVLADSSLDAAFTPALLNDGSEAPAMGGKYGYGWFMQQWRGLQSISHGGGLHGFVSQLSRYPEHNITVAVLANCTGAAKISPGNAASDVTGYYFHDLLSEQTTYRVDEQVPVKVYQDYTGRYEYPQGQIMTITFEDDRLFAQLTGQQRFEIYPKSETTFFWKVVEAQITFVRDPDGRVRSAVHKQGGSEFKAPMIQEEGAATIDMSVYDDYAGEYELALDRVITISRDGDQLFAQLSGQPKFEIFPRSETEFFLKVVVADIVFNRDDSGRVESLTLRQGGIVLKAVRK